MIDAVGVQDRSVAVEYELPLTSKRLDVLATGTSVDGPQAIVVELKQGDSVTPSNIEDCVETFVGGSLRAQLHPSRQVVEYQQCLEDTQTGYTEDRVGIGSCAYLHNLARTKAESLFAGEFAEVVAEVGGKMRSLDMQREDVRREAIDGAGTADALYASDLASDYEITEA